VVTKANFILEDFFFWSRLKNTSAVRGGKVILSSADILRTRGRKGSSDADVRTFWCKKCRIFWNLWCVSSPHGQRGKGVEPVRTFWKKEEGSIFRTLRGRLL